MNTDKSLDWGNIVFVVVMLFLLLCFLIGKANPTTDGVFESATEKIDSGRAYELTDREAQRIHNILDPD